MNNSPDTNINVKDDIKNDNKEEIVKEDVTDVVTDVVKEDVKEAVTEDVKDAVTEEVKDVKEEVKVHFEDDLNNQVVNLITNNNIIIKNISPLSPVTNNEFNKLSDALIKQFNGLDYEDALLSQVIKFSLTYIHKKNLDVQEKKHIVKTAVLTFFNKIGKPIPDSLFENSLNLIENIRKNGINKIKIDKKTIKNTKDIFETVYPIFCKEVEKRYPKTDDIIINILELSTIIAPLLNNFKGISGSDKKLILKKILLKFVNDLNIYYKDATPELKLKLKDTINGSMIFSDVIIGAINGQVSIEPEQITGIISCLLSCFKNFGKKSS